MDNNKVDIKDTKLNEEQTHQQKVESSVRQYKIKNYGQRYADATLNDLDFRYRKEKPTIITSNLTQQEFKQIYPEKICDRLFAKENTIVSVFGENESKRQKGL